MDLRIQIRKDSDLQISIFKDSFCAIVLRICEDLLDSWKQVESFENWLDLWSRYEPNLFKSGFVIHNTNRIFLSPDSWPTNQYKSMDLQNESMFLRISYMIPASLIFSNPGCLDLSQRGLDRDSQSQRQKRVSLDCRENLDSFKKLVSI